MRIVALAPNDWFDEWMNRQHLLSRLAGQHAIVYSNGVWASWDRPSPEYRQSPLLSRFERADGVDVDVRGKLLLRVPRVPALDRAVIQIACARWRRRLSPGRGPLIAYLFGSQYQPYLEALHADYLVYHAYDLFRQAGDVEDAAVRRENSLLESADLVIATSEETARDMHQRCGRSIEVLGNGVDWRRYQLGAHLEDPPELASIPHPRIGYVGVLNQKVDLPLIRELAHRRREWHFILAGPVRNILPEDNETVALLRGMPNVHLLGRLPQFRVPAILNRIDVGLICSRMSLSWARATYPLKMHEYLACGIPVVSSPLPAVEKFKHVIARAASADEWEDALDAAIRGHGQGDADSRRAVAQANSWDMRAARLSELLDEVVVPGRQNPAVSSAGS